MYDVPFCVYPLRRRHDQTLQILASQLENAPLRARQGGTPLRANFGAAGNPAPSPPVFNRAMEALLPGTLPDAMAVGDFTGDGKLGVVTANEFTNNVSVLLGDGEGGFSSATNYPVGNYPDAVAVGDFTGDGKLDLVVGYGNEQYISIMLGNGNGTFQAQQTLATTSGTGCIVVGDFNGDGNLDLAAACNTSIDMFLGNGLGGFSSPLVYSPGRPFDVGGGVSLAAGDFNGDGTLDLAATKQQFSDVGILMGNGNGTFQAPQTYTLGTTSSSGVALGDLTNDGKLDIIVADQNTNNISVLLGNGNGTFQAQQTFAAGTSPSSVAVGDFNNDGNLDVAVGDNNLPGTLTVLLGNGRGGFSRTTSYVAGTGVTAIAVGDFTGDGKLDMAAANEGFSSAVSILLGDGSGNFNAANVPVGANPQSVAVGDFTGNGNKDLAVANEGSDSLSILLGNGNGTFSSPTNNAFPFSPVAVVAADFNGDGNIDLAVDGGGFAVLLGNGNGTFSKPTIYSSSNVAPTTTIDLCVGNFNGYPDLAICGGNNFVVAATEATGTGVFTFDTKGPFVGQNLTAVAAGDFTGTGIVDLAFTSGISTGAADGDVVVLIGDGQGDFSNPTTYSVGLVPSAVAVGDFNGDGKLDLAVTDAITNSPLQVGNVSILLGNGNGTFQAAQNYASYNNPAAIAVGYFTGNGNLDVVTAGYGSLCLLQGDGAGGFAPPTYYLTGGGFDSDNSPDFIAIGDFNNNGGPGLAVVNQETNSVAILLNQAVASSFQISAPTFVSEGVPFQVTVTALDAAGNVAAGYEGTVDFSSSDAQAQLPAAATLLNGTGTFSLTLNSAGSETLSAVDSFNSAAVGTSAISVAPIAPSQLTVTAPAAVTAGKPIVVTVTALDAAGYITTGFADTLQFTSSDGQALLPPGSTLTGGVGFFAVVLKTAGTQMITLTDPSNPFLNGTSAAVTVSPAGTSQFAISGPPTAVAGSPVSFSITAEDSFGNLTAGFTGAVQLASTDTAAKLPASVRVTAGTGTFNATLETSAAGTPGRPGAQVIVATDAANSSLTGTGHIVVQDLTVSIFGPTSNGFLVAFDKPVDPATLNLYSGPADVLLMNSAGNVVNGSLVLNTISGWPQDASFTFVAAGGVLAAGNYTVTLVGGPGEITDAGGTQLDGNDSGIPGTNYTASFTVASTPSLVLSIPSFARGPDSNSDILLPNATGSGIPLTLTGAVGLTSVTFNLTYNPALLNISGAQSGPAGALTLSSNAPGVASFSFQSSTPLNGTVALGYLVAQVPNSAAASYKSKALLHLGNIAVNGTAAAANSDGIEAVAYLGDVAGTGSFSPLDAALMSQVAVKLSSGFAAFEQLDPAIIGDISGIGSTSSADITLMNRLLAGIATPQIPLPPSGLIILPTGPDPTLSLPADLTVTPGGTVTVPVNIDTARPEGSGGMMEATLALRYDPQFFSVTAADIKLGTVPSAGSGWQLDVAINPETGEIGITLFSTTPIQSTAGGSLVTITMQRVGSGQWAVGSDAGFGATASPLFLVNQVNPTGQQPFRTEVADAQGAFVLHISNGLVSGSSVQPAVNNIATAGENNASELQVAAHSLQPTGGYLEQVFGDLQLVLPEESRIAQPGVLLTSETNEQTSSERAMLQSLAVAQQDWLPAELLECLTGNGDGKLDNAADLTGLEEFFGKEASETRLQ